MDKSETYIKMCDCPEVQKNWKVIEGDFYYCCCKNMEDMPKGYGITILVPDEADIGNKLLPISPTDIWLPRQDQIQETMEQFMIKEKHMRGTWALEQYFHEWFLNKAKIEIYTTREQLWLAFYMHEKHDKIWDGNKWIKNNSY